MNAKEKAKLIRQASKLYALGLTVEKHREKLRRLVEKRVPYNSSQMKAALEEFQAADQEWKRLEREHLQYRAQLGIENEDFQLFVMRR